jgi:glycosyltransferase involved in cell wall biosynthesis
VNTGSTGRIVEQLGQHVLSNGWSSCIAYGRKSNNSISRTIRIGNEFDIALHGIKSRLLDKHGLGSAKATKKFIDRISVIKPDIIHLHNLHGYYLNYRILIDYLARTNMPVVWTIHDNWPITGHCTYFSDINCTKWKVECHHCPKKHNYPSSVILDLSQANFKLKKSLFTSLTKLVIVPVSKWLEGNLRESFLAKYPMQVINNGIDLTAFHPVRDGLKVKRKYKIPGKFMLLGLATAWGVRKGLDDFVKLSRSLSDDYSIVIVGLTKKQKELLPANIIGIGRIESLEELAGLYSAADIVLNLSYQETFGMTTVEGFACGTPGIVYNCTASPELITPETGLIVEPGNIEQLINAIKKIRSHGKEYYSKNCRIRAEQCYKKEDRFNEYLQLYSKLIIK